MTIDTKAIRAAAEADLECPIEYLEASISEIQSATLIYLLDRLDAAEVEVTEQARLLGISAEKELALMAKLEAAEKAKAGECCTRCVVFCQGGSGCHAGVLQISAIEKTKLISEQLERTK